MLHQAQARSTALSPALSALGAGVFGAAVFCAAVFCAAVFCAAVLSAGCGPAAAPVRVTTPFTAAHATAFENGVDFIADPTALGGSWLEGWEEDIDRRVRMSDAIALVTVTTVREDVDLDRRQTYRLIAHVDRARHGDLGQEVSLVVHHGDAGFGTVDGNEARILDQSFIAFVKWVDEGGQIVARWHLSPAADRIVRRVNTLIERMHTPHEQRRRVIIHETDSEGVDHEEAYEESESQPVDP